MLVLALVTTALIAGVFGMLPAVLTHRSIRPVDLGWAAGLWATTWVFCLCAYHRPGLNVGFDAFRMLAVAALCGWAGFCLAGLRALGRRGLRFVVPLLAVAALGAEVFVGNVAYFNTHSYEPFQLMDYLDPNVNVGRGNGTYTLDEQRAYLRFLNLDRPIYNLHLDGLVNDDTDPLHADSALFFKIEATDEANSGLNTFGTWQVGTQAPRTHTISLDLTGKVGTLTLTASGYSSTYAQYPVAITVTGITAKHTPAVGFLGAALWGGLSGVAGVVRASPGQRSLEASLAGWQSL